MLMTNLNFNLLKEQLKVFVDALHSCDFKFGGGELILVDGTNRNRIFYFLTCLRIAIVEVNLDQ